MVMSLSINQGRINVVILSFPNLELEISLHIFRSYLFSFIRVAEYIALYFIRFVVGYFVFDAIVKNLGFLILNYCFPLLIYRSTIDFYILTSHLMILLSSVISCCCFHLLFFLYFLYGIPQHVQNETF